MNIQAPKRPLSHPDRLLDCQEAMDVAFHDLMGNAIAAGWGPQEVADAIAQLTDAHLMWRLEKARTEAQIRQARTDADQRRRRSGRAARSIR
jgi:hypothetical protein